MANLNKSKCIDCVHCGEKNVDHYYLYTDRDSNGIETESYECGICRCISRFKAPIRVDVSNVNKHAPEVGTWSDCKKCGGIGTYYTVVYVNTRHDSYNNRTKTRGTRHDSCSACGYLSAMDLLPGDYGVKSTSAKMNCHYCNDFTECTLVTDDFTYQRPDGSVARNRNETRPKCSKCGTLGPPFLVDPDPGLFGPNPCRDMGTSRTPQESVTDNNALSGQCTCGADSVGGFHSKWCDKKV